MLIGVAVLWPAVSNSSAVGEDPLWQKALAIASNNEKWVPGFVVHNEEVYSRLGIRQENTETRSELSPHRNREVTVRFLSIVQNGRDITEEFVEEFGESIVLEEHEYRVAHPFRSSAQDRVSYTRQKGKKRIEGSPCIPFEFVYENERGTWRGTAWLEEESGTPLLVEGTLETVPLEEKWYTIAGLETSTTFITDDRGGWYPLSAVVDSRIEVVTKLFQSYKSRVKETYTFRDYWWYD
jgi:hypothetical protein